MSIQLASLQLEVLLQVLLVLAAGGAGVDGGVVGAGVG